MTLRVTSFPSAGGYKYKKKRLVTHRHHLLTTQLLIYIGAIKIAEEVRPRLTRKKNPGTTILKVKAQMDRILRKNHQNKVGLRLRFARQTKLGSHHTYFCVEHALPRIENYAFSLSGRHNPRFFFFFVPWLQCNCTFGTRIGLILLRNTPCCAA